MKNLQKADKQIFELLGKDLNRQESKIQLIPSENYTSKAVREVVGSTLMHKYSEGKVGERYYEGNEYVDEIEKLCIERARKVFEVPASWGVNVQALAGSNANLAVYNALLKPGDKILSMYLPDGGHLSHGWSWPEDGLSSEVDKRIYKGSSKVVSLVSKFYKIAQYKVDKETKQFNYDEIERIAKEQKPKLIISGGTAYSREIDHVRMANMAKLSNGFYLADTAHEAGLIAGGVNKNPVGVADVVTMTTHKTLRGPRGAIILSKEELSDAIDKSVFPGIQGGPFDNNIAAIAVCLKEAQGEEFKKYTKQMIKNAQVLSKELIKFGFDVLTGGTDKHLLVVDLRSKDVSGGYVARALDIAGITLNKNTVPFEEGSAQNPSGIRLGTPTVTTRGMGEREIVRIAKWLNMVVESIRKYSEEEFEGFREELLSIRGEVRKMCSEFPLD